MTSWSPGIHDSTLTLLIMTPGPLAPDRTPTETESEAALVGYSVQLSSTGEETSGAEIITARYRVSGPLDERVQANSRIRFHGLVHRVDGEPDHRHGDLPHTEFSMIHVKGA